MTFAAPVLVALAIIGGLNLLRFGRPLLLMFLALNFLPAAARLVPLFLLYVRLDLYDRQVGLILAYVAEHVLGLPRSY